MLSETVTRKERTQSLVNPFKLAYQPTAFEKVMAALSNTRDEDWWADNVLVPIKLMRQ